MKTETQLRKEFYDVVKGRNFMTPEVLDLIEIKNGVCELSKGRGIFSEYLYGVTCVVNGQKDDDLSTCFQEKSDALNYIKTLK